MSRIIQVWIEFLSIDCDLCRMQRFWKSAMTGPGLYPPMPEMPQRLEAELSSKSSGPNGSAIYRITGKDDATIRKEAHAAGWRTTWITEQPLDGFQGTNRRKIDVCPTCVAVAEALRKAFPDPDPTPRDDAGFPLENLNRPK